MTRCGSETPSGLRTSASSRSLQVRVDSHLHPMAAEAADTRRGGAERLERGPLVQNLVQNRLFQQALELIFSR